MPPKGIFPKPRPANLITVPSCGNCNGNTKLDDEYFRLIVSVASNNSSDGSAILTTRVFPKWREKPALLERLISSMRLVDAYSEGGIFVGARPAFTYSAKRLLNVIRKTVKGLYYHHICLPIPVPYDVKDFQLRPRLAKSFIPLVQALRRYDMGTDAFSYRYVVDEKEPGLSYWFLMFYKDVLIWTRTETNES